MNTRLSLQTLLYDGWILRSANGYTRRANSINPIYPPEINVNDKIEYCSKLYESKGLRTKS